MTSERLSAPNSVQHIEVSNKNLSNESDLSNVTQLLSVKSWDWTPGLLRLKLMPLSKAAILQRKNKTQYI